MRIDSIPFRPVRLTMVRFKAHGYRIFRGDEESRREIGSVEYVGGRWRARNTRPAPYTDKYTCSSFRAAVLHLARIWMYTSRDGPQDYGSVRMIRVQAGGDWYTVLFDKGGRYVYEDYSIPTERDSERGRVLSAGQQAGLRKVVSVAEKWAKENL